MTIKFKELSFNEKMVAMTFKEEVSHHLGGYFNMVQDGDMTDEEFNEMLVPSELNHVIDTMLSDGYKNGYIENQDNGVCTEAKHLKFLGTKRLNELRDFAIRVALKNF